MLWKTQENIYFNFEIKRKRKKLMNERTCFLCAMLFGMTLWNRWQRMSKSIWIDFNQNIRCARVQGRRVPSRSIKAIISIKRNGTKNWVECMWRLKCYLFLIHFHFISFNFWMWPFHFKSIRKWENYLVCWNRVKICGATFFRNFQPPWLREKIIQNLLHQIVLSRESDSQIFGRIL